MRGESALRPSDTDTLYIRDGISLKLGEHVDNSGSVKSCELCRVITMKGRLRVALDRSIAIVSTNC